MTLTVVLIQPYVGKNRRHAYGAGRLRLTNEARDWMRDMADMTAVEALRQHWQDTGGALALTVHHSNSRMDVDAPLPLVIDAVACGLGVNDRRFSRVVAERCAASEIGGIGVKVEVAQIA